MKRLPLAILTAEDRAAYKWAQEKCASARRQRAADRKLLKDTERALVAAGEAVVREWASGALAGAVRELDLAIEDYKEARK